MSLDSRLLNEIHQVALRYMNDLAKDPFHTHQMHLAKCWSLAVLEILKKEGLL